jgi:glycosyltransferase involved in cell wall biosynthesis
MLSVDIVVICKNNLKDLQRTINSIVSQSYLNFNVYIIDGKSNDGTYQYLLSIEDKNVNYISEEDSGIYHAMNKGLKSCKSDFSMFLNAGDIFYNSKSLNGMMSRITNKDFLYFGRTEIIKDEEHIQWLPNLNIVNIDLWLRNNIPCHPSILFPKGFYSKNNYDLYLLISSDNDYKIRALNECKYCFIDINMVKFYVGGISTSSNFKNIRVRFRERIYLNIKYSNKNIITIYLKTLVIFLIKLMIKK